MKKVSKLVLSAAVVGVFAGCGGDGDGIDLGVPSIVACFSAPKTVEFKLKWTNIPVGQAAANKRSAGPMSYNNQALTGQISFFPNGNTESTYWKVTSSGVEDVAMVSYRGTDTLNMVLPADMRPNQTIVGTSRNGNDTYTYSNTLVNFESLTLAEKTFPNTCHIRVENSRETGFTGDHWYAPGYGIVKQITNPGGITAQYDGDL
ncbi:MAG: hypothetical protein LBE78_01830 [Burkholderiaceae bacterium]|jgi:hypothetical protein|nr:hypothetical protein [Burkholderiaceae bacterium]